MQTAVLRKRRRPARSIHEGLAAARRRNGYERPQHNLILSQHISAVAKERIVAYDRDRAAEFALALMYLDVHDRRAWKGYPWDVLGVLVTT